MKNILLCLVFVSLLYGCNSCLSALYKVHDEQTPLNLFFKKSIPSENLLRNLDFLALNRNSADCYHPSIITEANDRIICFSNAKCECYLVSIEKESIAVPAIYIPRLNESFWITKREQIDDSTLTQIKQHIEESLRKMQL